MVSTELTCRLHPVGSLEAKSIWAVRRLRKCQRVVHATSTIPGRGANDPASRRRIRVIRGGAFPSSALGTCALRTQSAFMRRAPCLVMVFELRERLSQCSLAKEENMKEKTNRKTRRDNDMQTRQATGRTTRCFSGWRSLGCCIENHCDYGCCRYRLTVPASHVGQVVCDTSCVPS